jgi:hypothetical protein
MIPFPFQFGGFGSSLPVEAGGGDTDPDFSNVSLLLHMDGTNDSTTFTDNSPSPKTVTVYADAKISTTQSKFGGASCSLDGTGDFISVPASSDFDFGASDFTLECFIYLNAAPSGHGIITEEYVGNEVYFALAFCNGSPGSPDGNKLFFGNYQSGAWLGAVDSSGISISTWHHVAGVRYENLWTLYLNGTSVGSQTIAKTLAQQNKIQIGRRWDNGGGECLNGYIDELRITKGVARYTANFTPPAAPFPNS